MSANKEPVVDEKLAKEHGLSADEFRRVHEILGRDPSYTELGDPAQHEHRQYSAGGEGHFFAYTEEELRTAAKEAKLDVVELIYFESPWISGHFFFRFLHPFMPVRFLRAADRATLRVAPRKLAHQICIVLRRAP